MPTGRLIRLSNQLGEIEHPVYLVAASGLGRAIEALKNARVIDGREPQDIGPVSERLIDRFGLRPGQIVLMYPRNPKIPARQRPSLRRAADARAAAPEFSRTARAFSR
jgi:hypothetical protein